MRTRLHVRAGRHLVGFQKVPALQQCADRLLLGQGMRAATGGDLQALQDLMQPLEMEGILVPRTAAQLQADLPHFYVVDSRDSSRQVSALCVICRA